MWNLACTMWGMQQQASNALSRHDAAGYIGVSPHTLATWATRGGGPPFCRVGRRCVYLRGDLDAFLAAHRVTSTAAAIEAEAQPTAKAVPTAPEQPANVTSIRKGRTSKRAR